MAGRRGGGRSPWHPHLADLPRVNRKIIFGAGFVAFSALILVLVARMFAPFLDALLWAAVFAILSYPFNQFLRRTLRMPPVLSALLITLLITLGIFGVTFFLGRSLIMESQQAYQSIKVALEAEDAESLVERVAGLPAELLPGVFDEDSLDAVREWTGRMVGSTLTTFNQWVRGWIQGAIGNMARFLLNLFVTVISLFFLLRHGERWFGVLKETAPLAPRMREMIIERFTITFRAIVYGVLLGATIQSAMLTAGFMFFGVPLPVFFGVLGFFAVLLPVISTPMIWGSASLWLFLVAKDTMQAVGLALYGMVVLLPLAALIQPAFIGSQAKLPVFFVFLSILGGVMAFGAVGIILGPILLAIALAMSRIYRELAGQARGR